MKLKIGMQLVLETGEYSDYTFHGPFMVTRDFDQVEAVDLYKSIWTPPYKWREKPDTSGFMGWLASEGYIEPIEGVVSWHIGSYGTLEADPNPEPEAEVPA